MKHCILSALLLLLALAARPTCAADTATADAMTLHPRSRVESRLESGQFAIVQKSISWEPKKTAVIICDMWNGHYCKGAAARVAEMAPRANQFVAAARQRGG